MGLNLFWPVYLVGTCFFYQSNMFSLLFVLLTLCMPGIFSRLFDCLVPFFRMNFLKKNLSGILSGCPLGSRSESKVFEKDISR